MSRRRSHYVIIGSKPFEICLRSHQHHWTLLHFILYNYIAIIRRVLSMFWFKSLTRALLFWTLTKRIYLSYGIKECNYMTIHDHDSNGNIIHHFKVFHLELCKQRCKLSVWEEEILKTYNSVSSKTYLFL